MTTMEKDIIRKALKNNRPLLLLGKAGTAKTATINAIADELRLPVVTLPLAGIAPEDIGGMPRPDDMNNPTSFKYLVPEWFAKYDGKPFVLFLDEFNQATIATMHAMFYLVNDRTTAGKANPQMRIVAAGNTEDENEFLTPIPAPLMDRFVYRLKWKGNLNSSLEYLEKKYEDHPQTKNLIECIRRSPNDKLTARHVEQALFMVMDDIKDIERGRELIGSAYDVYLESLTTATQQEDDKRLNRLAEIKNLLKADKFRVENGKMTPVNKEALLAELTDEEKELLNVA